MQRKAKYSQGLGQSLCSSEESINTQIRRGTHGREGRHHLNFRLSICSSTSMKVISVLRKPCDQTEMKAEGKVHD